MSGPVCTCPHYDDMKYKGVFEVSAKPNRLKQAISDVRM